MAKVDLGGVWRTVGGRRIFIKDGEDLETAMKNSGKFGNKKSENNEKGNKNNDEKSDIISQKAKEQKWEEFKQNIKDRKIVELMKEKNIKSLNDMRKYWEEEKIKDFNKNDIKEIKIENAIDIVRNNIDDNVLKGWFVNADSSYKEKIVTKILENKDLRNAGLNIAYNNYIEDTKDKISFNDFVNKEIIMYRGEHGQETISKDIFKSYTTNKKIAEKFGNDISEIKIKPIETLGSFQTTGENEYLIPIKKIKK